MTPTWWRTIDTSYVAAIGAYIAPIEPNSAPSHLLAVSITKRSRGNTRMNRVPRQRGQGTSGRRGDGIGVVPIFVAHGAQLVMTSSLSVSSRGAGDEADAVAIASTPTLDRLWVPGVRAELRAHGKAVGLPSDDDMGNSEVGHNALGAGKVYAQGALLVGRAIRSGALFEGQVWRDVVARGARGGAIHFLGLLSDGNVHSHV